ncbi:putative mitochondrial protein AtMg00310 [Castanea sativa]|uniref:putative mitochondrial protein AtMg00310 n=1 Tax=Castanea sativa TaxID=21020 RepID=UPI003F650A8D
MSTFSIPNKVCDKLDSLTRRFLWKPRQREGGFMAWSAWDKLCYPRSLGGLGFKIANEVNSALLAKLARTMVSKRESICMRILISKYKARDDWLQANVPENTSPIWKAIEKAKSIVSKGACYLIGDGNSLIFGLIRGCHGFRGSFQLQNLHPY